MAVLNVCSDYMIGKQNKIEKFMRLLFFDIFICCFSPRTKDKYQQFLLPRLLRFWAK